MAGYLEARFVVTLMRLTEYGYMESGDREFVYYFAIPDAWASLPDDVLQERVFAAAEQMYAETNSRLQAAEPSDPNYLLVKSAPMRRLGPDEAAARPWLSNRPPVWDPSACVAVDADGYVRRVSAADFANAVSTERNSVRLDRVLPALLSKQLASCSAVYAELYERFQDPRPLDERSRYVWGAAVLFFCVLDRLASRGEYADPMATVEEMITWLAEGGEFARDDVESARQIYRRLFEYNVYRPNDTLFQMVYERAWSIRYPDLDSRNPSAFQGFIHCLTGCREALHNFDFDNPRSSASAPPNAYEKVVTFASAVLVPAFEEIRATLERHGKRVVVADDGRFGDEFLDRFFREIFPTPRFASELATSRPSEDEIASGKARYLGHSLLAVDAEPAASPYAGKFFETIVYVVGPDESVFASPFVVYHMQFDDKLHGFEHRFDNAQERMPVESIDKYAVQNHFLNAYDFFKIHARRDERPW